MCKKKAFGFRLEEGKQTHELRQAEEKQQMQMFTEMGVMGKRAATPHMTSDSWVTVE